MVKNTKRITTIFCIIFVAVAIVYDIIIQVEPTPNDTISWVIYKASVFPFIPFALFVLMGHFFGKFKYLIPGRIAILSIIGGIWLIFSILIACGVIDSIFSEHPMLNIWGILVGYFLWNQNRFDSLSDS